MSRQALLGVGTGPLRPARPHGAARPLRLHPRESDWQRVNPQIFNRAEADLNDKVEASCEFRHDEVTVENGDFPDGVTLTRVLGQRKNPVGSSLRLCVPVLCIDAPGPMADADVALSPSEATTAPRRFTREEYMRMLEADILTEDDPVELIHGQIVEMSPENSPHRVCIAKLNQSLVRKLGESGCFVQPQSTLPLDAYNLPEPDLAVLRGTPDELMEEELPVVLVVEVAETSLERDRGVKQSLYAEAEIPVYWIVNLAARELEVYSDPGSERYRERRTFEESDAVEIPGEPAGSITVSEMLPAAP